LEADLHGRWREAARAVMVLLSARGLPAGGSHPWQEPAGHRVRALEVTTGVWVYRLGRRCAADFIALLDQVLQAFPQAPALKNYVANTAVSWPSRLRQIRSF
jgi:hypothetical protein